MTAAFKVDRDGFYRIELDTPTGRAAAASPQYTIDVLTDQPPTVSFAKPGRDTSASAIEEVYVEAQAEDDFGVRDLELVYSVNGGAEKTVKLFGGRNRLPEVTAGHTFYLEELGVQPGDSVSYFARALDNSGGQPGRRQAICTSCASVRSGRTSVRRSRRAAVAAAAVAARRSGRGALGAAAADHLGDVQRAARSPHVLRRPSCARARRSSDCRSRGCASRSKGCSRV